MSVIIKNIVRCLEAIKRLFASGSEDKEAQMKTVHNVTPGEIYKNTMTLLKGGKDYPAYPPLYGKELKLLRRRLTQYQRMGWRADNLQREQSLKRLQKEWKRVLRNRLRKIKGRKEAYPFSGLRRERSVERSGEKVIITSLPYEDDAIK